MDYTQQPQPSHYAAPPTYYSSSTASGAIIGPISNPNPNPNPIPSFDHVPISVAQGIDPLGYAVSQYPPPTYAPYQSTMSSATGPVGLSAAYIGPMPTVGPIPRPGKKKKASNGVTAQDLEAKKQKLIETGADVNSIRTCAVCNVVCNNDTVFAFHIASAKHISKVNGRPCKGLAQRFVSEQGVYSNLSATKTKAKAKKTTVLGAVRTPTVAQSVYCDTCKVTCNTQEMYNNHVSGRKHSKNIKNLTACDRPIEFVPATSNLPKTQTPGTNHNDKKSVYCDLCKITCNTLEMYSIHVSGKKHNKRIKNLTVGGKPIQSVLGTSTSPGTQAPCTNDNDQELQKPATNNNHQEQQKPATNNNDREQQTPSTNDNDQEQQTPAVNDNDREQQTPASNANEQEQAAATNHDQEHTQMERKRKTKRKSMSKEDLEMKKRKMLKSGAKGDAVKVCDLCNVVCNGTTAFDDHCNGQKHRNMVKKQEEILGGSAVAPVVVSAEMAADPVVVSSEVAVAPVVISDEMSAPVVISAEMAAVPS